MSVAQSKTDTAGVFETLKADLGRIKDEVKTLASDAVHLPKDAMFGDLQNSVRREPLKSVAIAVGVGVVIGMILRR
jgi:ElaB/YqjD/DUF883 family membrane-anchored ribosome-binding protein